MNWLTRAFMLGPLPGASSPAPAAAAPVKAEDDPGVAISTITRESEAWTWFASNVSGGLPMPTERTALAVSGVYACVNLIAGAFTSIPIDLYDRAPNGDLTKRENDGLWWILNEEMTPRWSAAAGWSFLAQSLLLHGDAFAEIRRTPLGDTRGLLPIHPERVRVLPSPDGERLIYAVEAEQRADGKTGGAMRILDQDDMVHVPGFGFDGTRGLSVLRHALRSTGSVAIAMQDYRARFYSNGARPDYTINTEGTLSEEVIQQLYDKLAEYKGFEKAHRPMVLTGGLEVKPITMSLADQQLLDSQKFGLEEVCRVYGVPPFMVGHTEKTTSWGSGVEHMSIGFVRFALRPHLERFKSELNRKLFRTGRRVAEFNTADLERADIKTLMEALRIGLGRAGERPLLTQNEGRRVLHLPDSEGGNSLEPTPYKPSGDGNAQPPA